MIIECTNCHARYQYDEDRFERKTSKKIKCAKCGTVFEIHNPAFSQRKASTGDNDTTASRHDQTSITKVKPKVEDTTAQSPLPERETDNPPPTAELPKGKRLSLAIIDGSDAGNVFRINKPRVTIGRSTADFVINDTEASRQHAAIEVRDTTYLLSDLASTNGTLVDGKKITEPVELQDKSEFVIGTTTLMLIVTDEA
ncbi:MAG TPA: FHA domain-containing protein [Thermoanaerobaculia bacterium]|nr:FHA domain-containing protein [Thermoanaerobaculia bacterium]